MAKGRKTALGARPGGDRADKRQAVGKIVRWAAAVFAAAALACFICAIFALTLTPRDRVPELFGLSVLRVSGVSMEPELPDGSLVFVAKADPGSISEGDVISYYSDDPLLAGGVNTHRVIGVEDGGFATKGDANPVRDYNLAQSGKVIGKAVFHSLLLGRITGFFADRAVIAALAAAALLIAAFAVSIKFRGRK